MIISKFRNAQHYPPPEFSEAGRLRLGLLLSVAALSTIVTIAIVTWGQLYSHYLEVSGPEISVHEAPRGIGIAPVSLKLSVEDVGAGLDEVVIRTTQRGHVKELLRKNFSGQPKATIEVSFPGQQSGLEEGTVELEVRAFDRSLWSNSTTRAFEMRVDYRRPKIEILSSQHNARQGGSQLTFYRASDDDLVLSGVKVGSRMFPGVPVKGLDREITDDHIYAALYAIDMSSSPPEENDLRLYAEDSVGNSHSSGFYNHVIARQGHPVSLSVTDEFFRHTARPLAENFLRSVGNSNQAQDLDDPEKLRKALSEIMGQEEAIILPLLKNLSFESYWRGKFLVPLGSIQTRFGDRISYELNDKQIANFLQTGYEFSSPREVIAVNDGIALFSENIGTLGRVLAIDHGLGLVSLYGHLEEALVLKGQSVKRGQRIAIAGATGLARGTGLYFEMRVNGVPVDSNEWWSDEWFSPHILNKITELKQTLGIPVYKPL